MRKTGRVQSAKSETAGQMVFRLSFNSKLHPSLTRDRWKNSVTAVAGLVVAILFCSFTPIANAATITAASCAEGDVQAALKRASTGDTVTIPAGTCIWAEQVSITKGIVLQGAGAGNTIIRDAAPTTEAGSSPLIRWACEKNAAQRLTGIEFQNGGRVPAESIGIIRFVCTNTGATTLRVDHNKFDHINGAMLSIDTAVGVVDHNLFLTRPTRFPIIVRGSHWNNDPDGYGDRSWADEVSWGSSQFLFVEDNTFTYDPGTSYLCSDAYTGARMVYRFNTMIGCHYEIHGTESSGRQRGGRAVEIYKNNLDHRNTATLVQDIRSGTILAWGNTAVNLATTTPPVVVSQDIMRTIATFPARGNGFFGADGRSKWDTNDPRNPLTVQRVSNVLDGLRVQVIGAQWSPNQWKGLVIHKTSPCEDRNCFALIASNTSDVITYYDSGGSDFGNNLRLAPGDTFEINRVLQAIDQPGRGAGNLIKGTPPVAGSSWNNQVNVPSYEWLNLGNGAYIHFGVRASCSTCRENEHYYNYTPKFDGSAGVGSGPAANRPATCTTGVAYWATDEGEWWAANPGPDGRLYKCTAANTWSVFYTPYTYPHPLTASGAPQ